MSRLVDTYTVYKIITKLVTPWEKTQAYKYGIIDKNGNVLKTYKSLETKQEKESYTVLDKFIFNLKRLLQKLPGGKSKFATYATAALLLLKEEQENEKELI